MLNDILNDIWNNYRGRLFCSVFGLFVGVMVLWLGFFQALFLMICIGIGFFIGYKLDMKGTFWNGWIGFCRRATIDKWINIFIDNF